MAGNTHPAGRQALAGRTHSRHAGTQADGERRQAENTDPGAAETAGRPNPVVIQDPDPSMAAALQKQAGGIQAIAGSGTQKRFVARSHPGAGRYPGAAGRW